MLCLLEICFTGMKQINKQMLYMPKTATLFHRIIQLFAYLFLSILFWFHRMALTLRCVLNVSMFCILLLCSRLSFGLLGKWWKKTCTKREGERIWHTKSYYFWFAYVKISLQIYRMCGRSSDDGYGVSVIFVGRWRSFCGGFSHDYHIYENETS